MKFVNRALRIAGSLILAPMFAQGVCAQSAGAPSAPLPSQSRLTDHYEWVTLGTQGGPMPSAVRGEPANLLVKRGTAILVDAGDGAATRLVVSGAPFPALRYIFLSHLHVDHIGGLFGVIGLRDQMHSLTPLTIYGPPGTRALVAGIVAGLTPSAEAGYGLDGEPELKPDNALKVIEVNDGSVVTLPDMTVRVARNTHYTFSASNPLNKRYVSVAYRFDLPDRSIAYTGDTGPSEAVEKLAEGADLLVSEMIDPEWTQRVLAARSVGADPETIKLMQEHLTRHHLSPQQVAELAQRAGVKKVVITHLAGGGANDPGAEARYVAQVHTIFKGPVVISNDQDRF